jgi:Cys-tRNA(Pro) deacylase
MTLEEKIIGALQKNHIDYEVIEHEPVYTNPSMAEALGVSEAQTVKSLVLSTKEKKPVVFVMPGDKKIDWKAAAKTANTKKVGFAKPEEVKEMVGCEVGCVPPFGHMTDLPIYLDGALMHQPAVYFNPGVHHKSFKVIPRDLKKMCSGK